MRSTILLSLLSLAVGGCGDHGLPPGEDMAVPDDLSGVVMDMPPPDDARKIVTFTMFAQDLAQTLCAHYATCGQLDAAQMSACIERNLRHTGWDQDIEIMKGRMEINELQCLDAIKNSACDFSDERYWVTRCSQFLYIPHQTSGAACLSNQECIDGLFCQHAGSDGGVAPEQVTGCPGTCAPVKVTGVTCRQNSDCASDSYCDRGATNTCLKAGALNDDCSATPCKFGLMCPTFPATAPARCVLPTTGALNAACDPFQGLLSPTPPCNSGMFCQLQYTAGAACTGAPGDCASPPGSFCDTTAGMCQIPSGGKCAAKLASGSSCDINNTGSYTFVDDQCVDGTACYQLTGQSTAKCQAFGSVSGACVSTGGSTDTCKVGLWCKIPAAATQGTCTAWFSDGQTCDTTSHCPSSLQNVCIADNSDAGANTTCQVMRSFGQACTPGFEDSLCGASDLPGSTYCAPAGSSGVCAPKCF